MLYIHFCKYLHGGVRQLFFCSCKGRRGLTLCFPNVIWIRPCRHSRIGAWKKKAKRFVSASSGVFVLWVDGLVVCLFIVCRAVRVLTNFAKALLLFLPRRTLHDHFQVISLLMLWMIFCGRLTLFVWCPECPRVSRCSHALTFRMREREREVQPFSQSLPPFPPFAAIAALFLFWAHSFPLHIEILWFLAWRAVVVGSALSEVCCPTWKLNSRKKKTYRSLLVNHSSCPIIRRQ